MARSSHFYIRKSHRYLGLILGIQFLFWTIGGLYFSWSNMDEIHGDLTKKRTPLLPSDISLISPTIPLETIKKIHSVDSLVSIQLIDILGKPFYQIRCMGSIDHGKDHEGEHQSNLTSDQNKKHVNHNYPMNHLADAVTGQLRDPLSKNESLAVASYHFNGNTEVKSVEYLQNVGTHHEYREQPLPAYAITFKHPSNTTVYVASELGTVQKFRNNKWRVFDFFWMLHTMDYKSRDEIGNILLRLFSVFGLITIFSGFLLYFITSKRSKNKLL